MGCDDYNQYVVKLEPLRTIIDNEAAICMTKCNKDTTSNYNVAKRYYYVQQGTALQEKNLNWLEQNLS